MIFSSITNIFYERIEKHKQMDTILYFVGKYLPGKDVGGSEYSINKINITLEKINKISQFTVNKKSKIASLRMNGLEKWEANGVYLVHEITEENLLEYFKKDNSNMMVSTSTIILDDESKESPEDVLMKILKEFVIQKVNGLDLLIRDITCIVIIKGNKHFNIKLHIDQMEMKNNKESNVYELRISPLTISMCENDEFECDKYFEVMRIDNE